MLPKIPNKAAIEYESFRKLSIRERLWILLGCNLLVRSKVLVDRRRAKIWADSKVFITKQSSAEDQQREDAQQ